MSTCQDDRLHYQVEQLSDYEEIMPLEACGDLEMPLGSTYAEASLELAELPIEQVHRWADEHLADALKYAIGWDGAIF